MGGLAVIVDWRRGIDLAALDPMLELIPHRATGGTNRSAFDHAALAETHVRQDVSGRSDAITLGPLSIVGDLRLWNRAGLRSRAGSAATRAGADDRRLLLSAYERTGIGFLNDVDGDFAFVIWDDRNQMVIAARDRFGVVPLFFERTETGIRFATEPKQLVATSLAPVRPCDRSIAEYLTDHYTETRYTFFEGIHRVRPSMVLVADPERLTEDRYWNPDPGSVPRGPAGPPAEVFREHIVDSVRRRVAASNTTLAHLSGGLDSSSITAAAQILHERDQLGAQFHTISAIFPDTRIDESRWIGETVERQLFPHHDFVPRIASAESFDRDMWEADQPRVDRIRDMWATTVTIGNEVAADLVLTGRGGDQVLDQDQLVVDRLLHGHLRSRIRDAGTLAGTDPRRFFRILNDSARYAMPSAIKRPFRRLLRHHNATRTGLVAAGLLDALASGIPEAAPSHFGFPFESSNDIIAFTQDPTVAWINEVQETEYASRGLGLSHPYFDRTVVEYIVSIGVANRPLDGRSKTLIRAGFADVLPPAVLNRRRKVFADDYLNLLFVLHGAE